MERTTTHPIQSERLAQYIRTLGADETKFKVAEAARALKCHPSSLWNWLYGHFGRRNREALSRLGVAVVSCASENGAKWVTVAVAPEQYRLATVEFQGGRWVTVVRGPRQHRVTVEFQGAAVTALVAEVVPSSAGVYEWWAVLPEWEEVPPGFIEALDEDEYVALRRLLNEAVRAKNPDR